MKKFILDFLLRGAIACGMGPLVVAVIYWLLYLNGSVTMVSVTEMCLAIVTMTLLAFIAGGLTALYRFEKLPLSLAIALHGGVLYLTYLLVYLINGWLAVRILPILVFSGVFVAGYLVIWAFIYLFTKRRTRQLTELLQKKREET